MQPADFSFVRRQFQFAQPSFSEFSAIYQEVSKRMMERLDCIAMQPSRVLDLGCRSGYQFAALSEKWPAAEIVGADPVPVKTDSRRWWQRATSKAKIKINVLEADPHSLPFNDAEFDLVVCNLLLPWCHSPNQVLCSPRLGRIHCKSTLLYGKTLTPLCMYSV